MVLTKKKHFLVTLAILEHMDIVCAFCQILSNIRHDFSAYDVFRENMINTFLKIGIKY